jgi:hypothetical protein
MGEDAAKTILQLVEGKNFYKTNKPIIYEPELIIRNSTSRIENTMYKKIKGIKRRRNIEKILNDDKMKLRNNLYVRVLKVFS